MDNETMTPEKLLSSASAFCGFLAALSQYGLTNADGSAYREHPKCHAEDGIVLINRWNVNNYCEVQVASDRSATITRGQDAPASWGNPYPRVDRGELISVWRDGKWIKSGPWEEPIRELLASLIERLAEAKGLERREAEETAAQKERERQQRDMDLAAAWGGGEANG